MRYFKTIILTTFIIAIFSSCESPTDSATDTTPPSSIITFPTENDYVTGTVEVTCMASDNEGIEKVELWVDGIFTGLESTEEPFTFQWDTDEFDDNTSHTIVARAYDTNSNVKDSDPVIVIVIQNTDILVVQDLIDWNYLEETLLGFVNSYCVFTEVDGKSRLQQIFFNQTNKIFILPESFVTLTNLEYLYLSNQNLNSLPDEFGNLSNLTTLDLESNELTSLPESFGNLDSLSYLGLKNNQLSSLPESFGNLSNLTTLDLSYNQLTNVSDNIVCQIVNLNYLSWENWIYWNSDQQRIKLFGNSLYCLDGSFSETLLPDCLFNVWQELDNNGYSSDAEFAQQDCQ